MVSVEVVAAVARLLEAHAAAALRVAEVERAMARERAARARRLFGGESPVRRDGTIAPTPETVLKRVDSAVAVLLARRERDGKGIDPACARAAGEIEMIYSAVTAGLAMRVSRYGERLDRGSAGADWSARMVEARGRYRRWIDDPAQHERVGARDGAVVDVVLDAVVEGMGLRQVAERRRMDQRTVERVLTRSLEHYCLLAGWMTPPDARAA